jgi:predicted acyl esterase
MRAFLSFLLSLQATILTQLPVSVAQDLAGGEVVQGTLRIYGDDAYPVLYRKNQPITSPRARYPGFKPSTTLLKAGTVRREGAKVLPCDIVFERDVAVKLRDGITIYTDVFRPVGNKTVPGIIAWGPYGKEIGGQWLDDVPFRSGVPLSRVSELQKFEAPDPAYWVDKGYAVLNPDARGAYYSEGNITYWGRQLAEDGYDFVEWAAAQPWSSGKLGFSGNSYLAISQWFIAAENPPHLAAIAPWEGFQDGYGEASRRGGTAVQLSSLAEVNMFANFSRFPVSGRTSFRHTPVETTSKTKSACKSMNRRGSCLHTGKTRLRGWRKSRLQRILWLATPTPFILMDLSKASDASVPRRSG